MFSLDELRDAHGTVREALRPAPAFAGPPLARRLGASRIVLVSDAEIAAAIRIYWTDAHNLAEGAGAAGLAAALQEKSRLAGKRVGLALSGGNIDFELFERWVAPTCQAAADQPPISRAGAGASP